MQNKENLILIIRAGGSIDTDASGIPTPVLIEIAREVAQNEVTLTLRGAATKSPTDLANVARAGQGRVTFVFQ